MGYSACVTHDIDFITKYKSFRNILGATRRGNGFLKSINQYLKTQKNIKNDPYYNMHQLLEINNSYQLPTTFYFMSSKSNSTYDLNDYNVNDKLVKSTIRELKENGATIGLHPSYESHSSLEIIQKEKDILEQALGEEIIHSRQHYLNLSENTFEYLAKAGIKYDSTIGPQKTVTVTPTYNLPYTVFENEKFKLTEQPFLMMDTHLISHPENMLSKLKSAVKVLKENDGKAVIIWHNNNFDKKEHQNLYKEVLEIIK